MERYHELIKHIQEMESDFEKFYVKEQAAAGTRVRKGLNELKKLAQEIRLEIQEVKNKRKEG
jgi:hypothetical protein